MKFEEFFLQERKVFFELETLPPQGRRLGGGSGGKNALLEARGKIAVSEIFLVFVIKVDIEVGVF